MVKLDSRDAKLIAENRPKKTKKVIKFTMIAGLLILGFSMVVFHLKPGYTLPFMVAGAIIFFVAYFFGVLEAIKQSKELLKQWEQTGEFPPWPERKGRKEDKLTETPKP